MQKLNIGAPAMFVLDTFAVHGHMDATARADCLWAADQHQDPTVAHDP